MRLPDCLQQNEGEPASPDLLVLRHQSHHCIGADLFLGKTRDVLQPGRQAGGGEMPLDARRICFRDHAELGGEFRRQHHADGDALAMIKPVGESGSRFQRVPEGVTEIEQRTFAVLAFVAHHR